jgi:ornithine cyclodeaminase
LISEETPHSSSHTIITATALPLQERSIRAGEIIGPGEAAGTAENGQQRRRIDAQLGEVVLGTSAGRKHPDDIILVNPFGLAIEDIALAAHVYQAALKLNMGVWLER